MKKNLLVLLLCLFTVNGLDAKLYVSTEDIKVRRSKGAHAAVLGVIKTGIIIDVTETEGPWGVVAFGKKEGFIKTKYLREAAPAAPVAHEDTSTPPSPTSILLFAGGVLLFVFLLKRIISSKRFGTLGKRKTNAPVKHKPSIPIYWYQCKHCSAIVKKHDEPSHTGCLRSTLHHWTQMAEVGTDKYFCKQCLAKIQSTAMPNSEGCPAGGYHVWAQR